MRKKLSEKKSIYLSTVVCGVLLVVLVLGFIGCIWASLPVYPAFKKGVETEKELLKELEQDKVDIVYPDFLMNEYQLTDPEFYVGLESRDRFAKAEGYTISGTYTVGEKDCVIHITADRVGNEQPRTGDVEYRGIAYDEGIASGEKVSDVHFYHQDCSYTIYLWKYEDAEAWIDTEADVLRDIAFRMMDMAADGDTVTKR
ncbi:MAG: hypothetical protein IJZ85_05690 [Lachnospiraceae bacterium]|nr:hypothetical protein [Lachnospiraceae bacterium]